MSISADEEKNLFNFLRVKNCCLRCCFRFIGWRTVDCYQDPVEFAKRLKYLNIERDVDTPCIACLGILQDELQSKVIERIQDAIEKENYDCRTFSCALTVPVSVPLRERLLYAYCTAELNLSKATVDSLKMKIQNVKDVWKWVVIPKLEPVLKKRADQLPVQSGFSIKVFYTYEYDDDECKALLNVQKGGEKKNRNGKRERKGKNNQFSRKSMETLMTEITDEEFAQFFRDLTIDATKTVDLENIVYSQDSIFIGGRYAKLSRDLSQTPWFVNSEKKMETSVQDILCTPIAEAVNAESIKFLSSGREDVDVRNIYSGRPFAVELINPRLTNLTNELLAKLVDQINGSSDKVKLTSDLKLVSREELKKLKDGENVKKKYYRAVCVCRNSNSSFVDLKKLNNSKLVKIVQKTPVRVLHRRPLSPRTRFIYEMRARWAKPGELKKLLETADESENRFFILDLKTQAGTYVKEFVHGDFGRTRPSLCDLLKTDIDIVALDVTGINLKWP